MPVDPQVQTILDALEAAGGSKFVEMSAVDARAWFNAFRRPFDIPIGDVENRQIPGPGGDIPVRIFTPRTSEFRPTTSDRLLSRWRMGGRGSRFSRCGVPFTRQLPAAVKSCPSPTVLHRNTHGRRRRTIVLPP